MKTVRKTRGSRFFNGRSGYDTAPYVGIIRIRLEGSAIAVSAFGHKDHRHP